MKKTIFASILIITTAILAVGCGGDKKAKNQLVDENAPETFDDIIGGTTPVIVDFYADWCKPCKIQAPIIDELEAELGEKVKVVKVNVDYEEVLAERFKIQSIPTIMIFKEGKNIWQAVGVQDKETLRDVVLDAQ